MPPKSDDGLLDQNAQKLYNDFDGLDTGPLPTAPPDPSAPSTDLDDTQKWLDAEAQKIYESLGGLDTESRVSDLIGVSTGLAKMLSREAKALDAWHVVLIEFTHRLALCLTGFNLENEASDPETDMDELIHTLSALFRMPNHDGRILVRYHGLEIPGEARSHTTLDYRVSFGDLILDVPSAYALAQRDLATLHESPVRLQKAFERLAAINIASIHLTLGNWSTRDRNRVKTCLYALRRYCLEVSGTRPDRYFESDPSRDITVLSDVTGQPDPNLTMLTAINHLPPNKALKLVEQVDGFLRRPGKKGPLEFCSNVYEAVFAFRKLQEQLVKPPVDVNNIRWLIANEKGMARPEDIKGARLIMEHFSAAPQMAAQIVQSIYGQDFNRLNAITLGFRLGSIAEYLDHVDEKDLGYGLTADAIRNVKRGLMMVQPEVFERIMVSDGELEIRSEANESFRIKLHPHIVVLLNHIKSRLTTKGKVRQVFRRTVSFEDRDFQTIAQDYGITQEDAKRLMQLLQNCFDNEGRFLRGNFESRIPDFSEYGHKIFDILWHYLKEVMRREDRISFLNSLKMLLDRMRQHKEAMLILLNDLIDRPEKVTFFDRNALMLSNILLRRYNKELRTELDATPVDVLNVKSGLDEEMLQAARDFINRRQERFFQKIQAVHQYLESLLHAPPGEESGAIPLGYLVSLEKEAFIFFSLVGGPAAHAIMRAVTAEYGNPESEIYRLRGSEKNMDQIIPILEVAVRGLIRFGNDRDTPLLQDIKDMKEAFLSLIIDYEHEKRVKRVMYHLT